METKPSKTKIIIFFVFIFLLIVCFAILSLRAKLNSNKFEDDEKTGIAEIYNELKKAFEDASQTWATPEEKDEQIQKLAAQLAKELKNSETADWQTYTNEEYGFEFKYPEGLNKLDEMNHTNTIDKIVQISTIEETREKLDEYKKLGGCPGNCSRLIEDADLFEKQFEILSKSNECSYSEEYKNEIKENLILLHWDPGKIYIVDSIKNDNLQTCGLKLIGSAGYDAWIGNSYYTTVFLIDDKIITINLSLLRLGVFEEVDNFWEELGYHDGRCDEICYEKMLKYLKDENFFNQELAKNVIKKYDYLVKSLKLID